MCTQKKNSYFLGLGSNLGDKKKNLERVVSHLKKAGVDVLCSSSYYLTQPVGLLNQPWFLNQVIEVETDLSPRGLLELTKNIEKKMERRPSVRDGPRLIDVDILLAGDLVLKTESLVIPHPRMTERNFILTPLKEIAPQVVHPLLGEKIKDIWKKSKGHSVVKKVMEKEII